MATINLKTREIEAKIVYYGCGRGGKTTNLEYIYKTYKKQVAGDMVSITTEGDRTLFFDFLPIGLGKIRGFDIKIQLYTVPGQVQYSSTRKLVLKEVDGLVFCRGFPESPSGKKYDLFEGHAEKFKGIRLKYL